MKPTRFLIALMAVVLSGLVGCSRPPTTGGGTAPSVTEATTEPDLFEEVAVDAAYRNGEEARHYAILETLGGGVALFDHDGDGRLDLFVCGGGGFERGAVRGRSSTLLRNLGDWRFQDVTAAAGLDAPLFYTHGCAAADYDRDGWVDLVVTGYERVVLYHNEPNGNGGRRFVDVTERSGLKGDGWNTGAAWGDLDGDGFPELYICRYVDWRFRPDESPCLGFDRKTRDICPPRNYRPVAHRLWRNRGDGSFTEVSREAGLLQDGPGREYGRGLGVLFADLNGDARPDIYVANDMTDNFLYLNRSRPGTVRLEEVGVGAGVARDDVGSPNGSMGVSVADYDGTGRPSLWVTNYEAENHALYHHSGLRDVPAFRFATQVAGISALGQHYVGWGTGFLDLERRGREDLFFTNGHPNYHPQMKGPREQQPVLLRNGGNGRFTPITPRGGPYFRTGHGGRGAAVGDLDDDGRPDLVISHLNGPVAVLKNVAPVQGRHWLGVELVGAGQRDLAGARVVVEAGGRRQTRFHHGGGSYLSSADRRHLFGLGDADRVERVTVTWPGGREQTWPALAVDRYWRLSEGTGQP